MKTAKELFNANSSQSSWHGVKMMDSKQFAAAIAEHDREIVEKVQKYYQHLPEDNAHESSFAQGVLSAINLIKESQK